MHRAENPVARFVIIAVLLLAVLLGAQALGQVSAPAGGVASTGRLIGQTSFAYMGGIRTFVAAVLWNRLDPIFHGYYSASFGKDFVVFLPTFRLVIALDPQFQQAYYTASYYLARSGRVDQGLALAREGVANNPTSGLLRANYIQVLELQNRVANRAEMLKQAQIGIGPTITYANIDDEFESLGVFRSIFATSGDTKTAGVLQGVQEALRAQGASPGAEREIPIPPIPAGKQ